MLERKVNTTVEVLCHGIPVEFTSLLIYTCSLAFSEDPDYDYLHSLLHGVPDTSPTPTPATCLLDFGQPNPIIHIPAFSNGQVVAKAGATTSNEGKPSSQIHFLHPRNSPGPLPATASTPHRNKELL
ncbi:hypothetical protein F4604DRAFT_1924005 [Suillus subluteus]|nr:hypothetical protein F4604DRAFT_1924005 [Suillus subluteus]